LLSSKRINKIAFDQQKELNDEIRKLKRKNDKLKSDQDEIEEEKDELVAKNRQLNRQSKGTKIYKQRRNKKRK